jgi:hypothetical protein
MFHTQLPAFWPLDLQAGSSLIDPFDIVFLKKILFPNKKGGQKNAVE